MKGSRSGNCGFPAVMSERDVRPRLLLPPPTIPEVRGSGCASPGLERALASPSPTTLRIPGHRSRSVDDSGSRWRVTSPFANKNPQPPQSGSLRRGPIRAP
ncbi:hypothetical protein NDU88_004440 [Pleurodeles waltl]|uniref:Uncharacterized protein n=1 Tax=Pleurodeles waltl TaxID=8319 RepID=A0AAV7SIT8_PLEWA|nr:hypothetical protein NDU88_004440 [Pleurodeles waltl]